VGSAVRNIQLKDRALLLRVICVLLFLAACVSFTTNADDTVEPAWVYKGRGDRYYRDGQVGRAIYEYKKALIKANRDGAVYPEVNLQLAKIYKDEGLYELALSQVDIVQNNRSRLQIPDLSYEALYTKADVYIRMERYDEALKVYEGIIGQDDNWLAYAETNLYELEANVIDDITARTRFAEAYLRVGMIKYMTHNYENAIPSLKMALLYRHKADKTLRYLISCYEKVENRKATEYLKGIMERGEVTNSRSRS
jgi:tetratricopeptide (TPR) repeat protein